MAKETKSPLAAVHTLRLSHNWDIDPEKEVFVCSDDESLFFSVAALANVSCRGCGSEVTLAVYGKHSKRWTESASPLYWVVDKVLNEVIAPCACRRCELRRRTQPNYRGLTSKGPAAEKAS